MNLLAQRTHLLTIDYSDTGPLEVSVTFSSAACNKTSFTDIYGKKTINFSPVLFI